MMSRNFTSREKLLIVALCVLLLGLAYYYFVVKEVDKTIAAYDTIDLETELLIEETKAANMIQMKAEMENNMSMTGKVVASYNNVKNELSALNTIFAMAKSYNLDFSMAVKDGDTVRRDINVTFTAESYDRAVSILKELYNCKYRCLIRNLSIASSVESVGINSGAVSVSLLVTFFETTYNANTQGGLEDANNEGNKK